MSDETKVSTHTVFFLRNFHFVWVEKSDMVAFDVATLILLALKRLFTSFSIRATSRVGTTPTLVERERRRSDNIKPDKMYTRHLLCIDQRQPFFNRQQ